MMTHAVAPLDIDERRDDARDDLKEDHAEQRARDASVVRATLAVLTGLAILIVAFANLSRIAGWGVEYVTVGVYLGFFLVMSLAGRLFWWGTDILVGRMIHGGQGRQ